MYMQTCDQETINLIQWDIFPLTVLRNTKDCLVKCGSSNPHYTDTTTKEPPREKIGQTPAEIFVR